MPELGSGSEQVWCDLFFPPGPFLRRRESTAKASFEATTMNSTSGSVGKNIGDAGHVRCHALLLRKRDGPISCIS